MRVLSLILMFFVPSTLLAKDYICVFQDGSESVLSNSAKYGSFLSHEVIEPYLNANRTLTALSLPEYFSMNEKFLEERALQRRPNARVEASYPEGAVVISIFERTGKHEVWLTHISFVGAKKALVVHETRTIQYQTTDLRSESNMYHYRCIRDI